MVSRRVVYRRVAETVFDGALRLPARSNALT
jgi:hypothetical protein